MNRRKAAIGVLVLGVLLVAAGLVWMAFRTDPPGVGTPRPSPAGVARPESPPAPAQHAAPVAAAAGRRPPVIIADSATSFAEEYGVASEPPESDLAAVDAVLGVYRRAFTGNPIGTNEEITAALVGGNAKRYAVIPPGHPAINEKGELTDRWGTALFFHALSGEHIELRSAGPDRKFWTADDIVYE